MNRKELLSTTLAEDKSVSVLVESTLKKDAKAISRAKRDVEDKIDELEEQLTERLSANTPLDKSVVEVLYSSLKDMKGTLKLYNSFEKEFLSNED